MKFEHKELHVSGAASPHAEHLLFISMHYVPKLAQWHFLSNCFNPNSLFIEENIYSSGVKSVRKSVAILTL